MVNEDTTTIQSGRLSLRPPVASDAGFVLDMYSRQSVTRFIGASDWRETSREQALQRIQRYRVHFGTTTGVWLVEAREDQRPVGFALLKPIPFSADIDADHQDIEVGWHLHPDSWGQGYATEAAKVLVARAKAHGLTTLVAVTHQDNRASMAVAQRVGMTHQGSTRRYYDTSCELFSLSF